MIEIVMAGGYAVLSAGFAFGLHHYAAMDAVSAALFGAVLFLLLLQLRNTLLRLRDAQHFENNLEILRGADASIRSVLDEACKTIAELGEAFTKRTASQEKKLIGELKTIERLLRENATGFVQRSADPLPAVLPDRAVPARPKAVSLTDPMLLEMIRLSLEENRVDLYLQPIVTLPQRRVRYYEALTRLRSDDGAVIMPAQFIRVAAPAGLMSVVDNLLLFRCVQVVRRLTQRNRDTAVFCNISGHTLHDADFFPQFLDFLHQHKDLSGRIVFEFAQEAVLGASPAAEANLRYLAEMGFRLSIDQVTKLDVDFVKLKRLGFRFLKVRANTLSSGMKSIHADIAAEDLKDLLARSGISLIVERIEDERSVVQLLEFNVDFGQGYLFGEPKPVREIPEFSDAPVPAAPAAATSLRGVKRLTA